MSEYRHGNGPVYDESDAMRIVADKLHASRGIEEVLDDLADASPTLAWLAERVELTDVHAARFRRLLSQAERLNKLRADELEALNGGGLAMTDRYENIRLALAMEPTPGPWDGDDNSVSRLWSNGTAGIREYIALPDGAEGSAPNPADMHFIAACDPDTIRELLAERDGLAAENARLREALHVVSECGDPCKVILYDEEGIEGWRWTHPDGREWEEVGEWCEGPPLHPVARAALSAAERADGRCR